jgi:uncharacterized protein YtpQ (UPF0354 family)
MASVEQMFEEELQRRGVRFARDREAGVYQVDTTDGRRTVSLANIGREYAREGDPGVITRFVAQVLANLELPSWQEARARVFFSVEPNDYQFGDTLRESVTDEVEKVLVWSDQEEGRITWLSPSILEEWGVERAEVEAAALENLDRLLSGMSLEIEDIDGTKLGMLSADSVLKASLIFAPGWKRFVAPVIGWPVLVVIPCRDFLYVLSERNVDFLNRLGHTVQQEYRRSAYPITTEVLRLSDQGLEAIGSFPK